MKERKKEKEKVKNECNLPDRRYRFPRVLLRRIAPSLAHSGQQAAE
jgi:hypothetical protein